MYEWSNVWQLQIAVDKCFVCDIYPGNQRSNVDLYNYVLNIHVLEKVDVVPDLGVHVDCFLKFDHHISFIVHNAMTRARLIRKCFLSRDRELLFKAYCVYVRPLLEYCSAVWSPHLKCLVVKTESVQQFFTKRLQGMWNKGYNDHLRLLNTHSLEHRCIYSDLVLCFQLLSNGFNSQLVNALVKSTDNRTRGHSLKLIKQRCSVDANITLPIV